jgi:D-alanyl-D-alanine carboxypeptidase
MRHRVFHKTFPAILAGLLLAAATPALAGPSILFDVKTGQVLEHEDAFKRWYPASLTKLMTAYVAFRAIEAGELTLQSPIKVTKTAAAEPPSKMGYKPGSAMTLDNALKMTLIKSANDVAMMIAETVAGSEEAFVARMNDAAKHLNMTRTVFANPNGLPDERQVTTARDLAKLARAIIIEFPEHAALFTTVTVQVASRSIRTHNALLGIYPGASGISPGEMCEAA